MLGWLTEKCDPAAPCVPHDSSGPNLKPSRHPQNRSPGSSRLTVTCFILTRFAPWGPSVDRISYLKSTAAMSKRQVPEPRRFQKEHDPICDMREPLPPPIPPPVGFTLALRWQDAIKARQDDVQSRKLSDSTSRPVVTAGAGASARRRCALGAGGQYLFWTRSRGRCRGATPCDGMYAELGTRPGGRHGQAWP